MAQVLRAGCVSSDTKSRSVGGAMTRMDSTPVLHEAAWALMEARMVGVIDERGSLGKLCVAALAGSRFRVADVVDDHTLLADLALDAAVVGGGGSVLERPRQLAELTAARPESRPSPSSPRAAWRSVERSPPAHARSS